MKNIWTIMSKEFARFFGDRRMILATLLPAVAIYVLYTLMGSFMGGMFTADEDHTPRIYAVNAPASITQIVEQAGMILQGIDASEIDAVKERIIESEADLLMVFPADFDALVEAYDVRTATQPAPNIEMYFIATEANSETTAWMMRMILDEHEDSIANKFDINRDIENADLSTAQDFTSMIISMMMPLMLMIFLYSGCMGLALESITGEKERGTLATLLVSPLKRRELAIGKILSLAVLSFLSGIVTAIATILSLPSLMAVDGMDGMFDANIYSVVDYVLLALVILTVLLLMVAMLSIVSAFAKTVREANTAATPLMILVILTGISGMLGGGAPTGPIHYLIPLYGSVQSMTGIFSLDYSTVNVLLSCLSALVFAGIGGVVLTKMFNSEKVMFSR